MKDRLPRKKKKQIKKKRVYLKCVSREYFRVSLAIHIYNKYVKKHIYDFEN